MQIHLYGRNPAMDDGRIAAVGPAAQVPLPTGSQVVDVGDRTIMPGLIDAHVHILSTGSAVSGQASRTMTDHQVLLVGARNAQLALQVVSPPCGTAATAGI